MKISLTGGASISVIATEKQPVDYREFKTVGLPRMGTRCSRTVNLDRYGGKVRIDFAPSVFGSDSNYFSLIAVDNPIYYAFGGYYCDKEGGRYRDDPPANEDFMIMGEKGHYAAQGRMFASYVRLWVQGSGRINIVY